MNSALPSRLRAMGLKVPAHWLIMGTLFVGALGIGFALLPGQVQRVAMLERDGQAHEALELLEKSYSDGSHDIRSLMQIEQLYEQQGQLDKARAVLAELVERQPRDANVLKRGALFYKMTQDDDAYIATLSRQVALKYTEDTCRELIGILRLRNATTAEQAAIQDCRRHGYRRSDDIVRLASLVTVDGDLAQASALLRSVDDLRRLKSEKERTQLIATLLDLDQPREAYRRAVRWLRGQRETRLALSLITQFANANQHDIGIELAKDISAPGDAVSLSIAELMLDRGQPLAAQSYLRGWLEKAQLNNAELISRFIVATLDAEDPDAAMLAGRRYGLTKLPQPDLVSLAEALAATGRQADFDTIRDLIKPDVLAENPLLGAAAALQSGAPEAGQSLLSTVAVDELDEWRLSLWARLMDRTGKTAVANETLRKMGVDATPEAQPERVAVVPRMIRRPKRVVRARYKRFPSSAAGRARQNAPPPSLFNPFNWTNSPGGG